jgi:hypothetical protein
MHARFVALRNADRLLRLNALRLWPPPPSTTRLPSNRSAPLLGDRDLELLNRYSSLGALSDCSESAIGQNSPLATRRQNLSREYMTPCPSRSGASLLNEPALPIEMDTAAARFQLSAEEARQRNGNTQSDEIVILSEPPTLAADSKVAEFLATKSEAVTADMSVWPYVRDGEGGQVAGILFAGSTPTTMAATALAKSMAEISEQVYQLSSRGSDGGAYSSRIARLAAALRDSSSSSLWYTRCAPSNTGARVACEASSEPLIQGKPGKDPMYRNQSLESAARP